MATEQLSSSNFPLAGSEATEGGAGSGDSPRLWSLLRKSNILSKEQLIFASSRPNVRMYECPECGAFGGEMCRRQNGRERISCHAGRVIIAINDAVRKVSLT